MWISVKQFQQLMGWPGDAIINACKRGGIFFKYANGVPKKKHRICINNLTPRPLARYLSDKIIELNTYKTVNENADLLHIHEYINTMEYKKMRPLEKKHVDKWFHILYDTDGIKGEYLYRYLKNINIAFSTFRRWRNAWIRSGRNINSLKTNYHYGPRKLSK